MLTLHPPSPPSSSEMILLNFLSCTFSCSTVTQSKSDGIPAVGPYWRPSARAEGVREIVRSDDDEVADESFSEGGAFAVNVMEVNGNEEGLGFPARREIMPGWFSRGNRLRTGRFW